MLPLIGRGKELCEQDVAELTHSLLGELFAILLHHGLNGRGNVGHILRDAPSRQKIILIENLLVMLLPPLHDANPDLHLPTLFFLNAPRRILHPINQFFFF